MKLLSVAEVGVITVVGVVGVVSVVAVVIVGIVVTEVTVVGVVIVVAVVSVVGVVGVCFSFFSLKRKPFLSYENTVFPPRLNILISSADFRLKIFSYYSLIVFKKKKLIMILFNLGLYILVINSSELNKT